MHGGKQGRIDSQFKNLKFKRNVSPVHLIPASFSSG